MGTFKSFLKTLLGHPLKEVLLSFPCSNKLFKVRQVIDLFSIVVVPSVAYQLMVGVIVIAVAMTPIGIWRLRRMDLVEKVKDLSQ